ncbi:unnamed protein product, partial [Mesorhabditis belari]|uniref:F-box domain-containing protein n=1 Tax=Mesorhabditis belari TaxID=2138241 RepID=A0AAF3JAR3_9BILA
MFPLSKISPKNLDSILEKIQPDDLLNFLKVNKTLRNRVLHFGPLPRNLESLQLYQIEGKETNGNEDHSRALATFKAHSKTNYFTFSIWPNFDFTVTSKFRLCYRIRLKNVTNGVNIVCRFIRACAKVSLRFHNDNVSTTITDCLSNLHFVENLHLSTCNEYLTDLSNSLPQATNQLILEVAETDETDDFSALRLLEHAKTLVINQRLRLLWERLQKTYIEDILNHGCFSDFWETVKRCLTEGIPSAAEKSTLLLSHRGGGSHRVYLKEFDEMLLQLKNFPELQTLTARSEKTRWISKLFTGKYGKFTDSRSLKKDVRPNHFFRRKVGDTMENVMMMSFECYSLYEPDGRVSDYRKIDIKIFIATIRAEGPEACSRKQIFDHQPCAPSNHLPPIPVVTQGGDDSKN